MPLLTDSLTVWEIAFRWENLDPRRICLRIPLAVQDHFRNLADAILSGDLACETITLEKREFSQDEKEFSIYHWIDDIYTCIAGHAFNRKLLRHASIGRYDLQLWCQRRNIPVPDFWFPPGWNLEYEYPEDDLKPGYYFMRQDWSAEDWKAEKDAKGQAKSIEGESPPCDTKTPAPFEQAAAKLRPSQETSIACQQIAKAIWKKEPSRTIASVIKDPLLQEYGGAAHFQEETVREWVKHVAPPHVRKPGRPKKNGDAEQ
jgi:hypothetical protein